MLIIESVFGSTAITWDGIESICFDEKSCAPDTVVRVATKGGNSHTAINATDLAGEAVDFNVLMKAWLDDYTAWTIKENSSKNAPQLAH